MKTISFFSILAMIFFFYVLNYEISLYSCDFGEFTNNICLRDRIILSLMTGLGRSIDFCSGWDYWFSCYTNACLMISYTEIITFIFIILLIYCTTVAESFFENFIRKTSLSEFELENFRKEYYRLYKNLQKFNSKLSFSVSALKFKILTSLVVNFHMLYLTFSAYSEEHSSTSGRLLEQSVYYYFSLDQF